MTVRFVNMVVAALLVMLAACADSGDVGGRSAPSPSAEEPEPDELEGAPEVVASALRLGQPLARFIDLTGEDGRVVSNAVQVAISRCMEERGLRYEEGVQKGPVQGVESLVQEVMAVRQEPPETVVGYGFSEWNAAQDPPSGRPGLLEEGEPALGPEDPNFWVNEIPADERARWSRALVGDPQSSDQETLQVGEATYFWDPNSCASIGQEAIYGDLTEWYQAQVVAGTQAVQEATQKLLDDPAVVAATESWVGCMAEAGFDYADLEAPLMDLAVRFPLGTAASVSLPAEAKVAPVDAACFQEADLPRILRSVQERIEAEVLEQYEGALLAYAEINDAAVQRARALE